MLPQSMRLKGVLTRSFRASICGVPEVEYEKYFKKFSIFWRHRTAILVPFHLLEGSKLSIVHNALQILR